MSEVHPVVKWAMGIAASLITASIIGTAAMLFDMNGRISTLEATQIQLIKQIDRTLDALTQD